MRKGPFKKYVTPRGGRGGLRKCYGVLCGGRGCLGMRYVTADFSGNNNFVKKWQKSAPKTLKGRGGGPSGMLRYF